MLTTRYGFRDTPTPGDPSLEWVHVSTPSIVGATTLVLNSVAGLPSSVEFDIEVGARQLNGTVINVEIAHVLSISGTTLTLQSGLTFAHAALESVYHTLTALGLKNNPQGLTDSGDISFLNASARMDRWAAPSDGDYVARWASGVPSWTTGPTFGSAITAPDFHWSGGKVRNTVLAGPVSGSDAVPDFRALVAADIPDLSASYPSATATRTANTIYAGPISGSAAAASFRALVAADIPDVSGSYVPITRTVNGHALSANVTVTASDVGLGSVENAAASGLYALLTRTVNGHALSADVTVSASDLGTGTLPLARLVGITTTQFASAAVSQWTNDSGYVVAHNVLSSTHTDALAASVTRGAIIYGNATPKWATLVAPGALSGLSHDGTDVSWVTATGTGSPVRGTSPTIVTPTVASFVNATHSHLNATGGGTITAAAISDLGSATVAFTNKSGNISQWTNDSGYLTVGTEGHTVLSSIHTDTLADTVVRGDILYGNSTPKWARLAKPSVLSGLSHDGTDVSWVTATGTGAPARATSPVFVTPTLGVASATSINNYTLTAPASGATLTILDGKTLTVNDTITIAPGGSGITMTTPTTSFTAARTDAANTFTLANNTTNTITGGSVTGSGTTPFLSVSGTWNTSGVATAFLVNITNTASDSASLLIDAQLGSTSIFKVSKGGFITSNSGGAGITVNGTATFGGSAVQVTGANGLTTDVTTPLSWGSSGVSSPDLKLYRDAANTLALRNATNAQTYRIYETFTDASNYSRLAISAPSGGPITFASEAAGTGTARAFSFTGGNVSFSGTVTAGAGPNVFPYQQNATALSSSTWSLYNTGLTLFGGLYVQWSVTGGANPNNVDLLLGRAAAASLQLGVDVNGAATAQTLQSANAITGSNIAGANFTVRSGAGMGTGTVSSLIFQTPTIAASGANTQARATRLTINSTTFTLADALDMVFGTTTGTKFGTATSQKMAWWNATPVVQPTTAGAAATFVANTSLIANDTATFDGYTLGQVVKALRTIGVLA